MKQKTNKSAAKRLKVTKTGKIMRRVAFGRHLRSHKQKKTLRRYKQMKLVSGKIGRRARRLLALA